MEIQNCEELAILDIAKFPVCLNLPEVTDPCHQLTKTHVL